MDYLEKDLKKRKFEAIIKHYDGGESVLTIERKIPTIGIEADHPSFIPTIRGYKELFDGQCYLLCFREILD